MLGKVSWVHPRLTLSKCSTCEHTRLNVCYMCCPAPQVWVTWACLQSSSPIFRYFPTMANCSSMKAKDKHFRFSEPALLFLKYLTLYLCPEYTYTFMTICRKKDKGHYFFLVMVTWCPPSSGYCYIYPCEGSNVQGISALSRAGSVALFEVKYIKWCFQRCLQGIQAGATCKKWDAQHKRHPDVSLISLQLGGKLECVRLPSQDLGAYSLPKPCFTYQSPLTNIASSHKRILRTVILHKIVEHTGSEGELTNFHPKYLYLCIKGFYHPLGYHPGSLHLSTTLS